MLEELEELKEQKCAMESEAQQIEIENQKVPNLKDKAINKIKEEIQRTEGHIFKVEGKKQEMVHEIDKVRTGLNMLFQLLHLQMDKGKEPMQEITNENMEECLGKIEKKINLVMKMVKDAGLQELLVENVHEASTKKSQKSSGYQMKGLEEFMSKTNQTPRALKPGKPRRTTTSLPAERPSRSPFVPRSMSF
jgi:hypothetical protein